MKTEICKGFRDLSTGEMKRFRVIEETFRNTCLKWGYQEVRTPTLEYLYLFTATGTLTPGLLNRVYSFLDWDGWSGERVVLRPDGTIPVARMYIDSITDEELARLFYVTNIFIFEETGKEAREKWQCGVELIGASSPLADVELIAMAAEVLRSLKLGDIGLKLSHAGVIKALLAGLGLSHEEQTALFDRILDGDITVLSKIKPEKVALGKTITALLDMKGESAGLLKNLKSLYAAGLPELKAPLDDFINIVNLLDNLGIDFQIDMDTGRGFEYYTGLIFHLSVNGESVGGGGRYNALIPFMSGKQIPASGFALYLDRLMYMISPPDVLYAPEKQDILVRVEADEPAAVKAGFALVNSIHETGNIAELSLVPHHRSDYAWTVDVKNTGLVLTNNKTRKKFTARNAAEIIKLLKNERANTHSITKRSSSR
jgi:histidyl-tRNA synthetase